MVATLGLPAPNPQTLLRALFNERLVSLWPYGCVVARDGKRSMIDNNRIVRIHFFLWKLTQFADDHSTCIGRDSTLKPHHSSRVVVGSVTSWYEVSRDVMALIVTLGEHNQDLVTTCET